MVERKSVEEEGGQQVEGSRVKKMEVGGGRKLQK